MGSQSLAAAQRPPRAGHRPPGRWLLQLGLVAGLVGWSVPVEVYPEAEAALRVPGDDPAQPPRPGWREGKRNIGRGEEGDDGWEAGDVRDTPRRRGRGRLLIAPPGQPKQLASAVPAEVLFTIHQTNRVVDPLPPATQKWQQSWKDLGFRTALLDDDQCRADIVRLSKQLNRSDYLTTYDNLETAVMRADLWRYARLYLEGGIYADMDVIAHDQIRPLLSRVFCEKCSREGDAVVFVESDWAAEWRVIAFLALNFKMTDMVRLPQYRQCILVAGRPHHPLYKLTLDMIVDAFSDGEWQTKHGLARTLLLTGPGVFTDAVRRYEKEHAHAFVTYISRHEGQVHYEHVGAGTWKPKKSLFLREQPGLAILILAAAHLCFVVPSLELGRNRRMRQQGWNVLFGAQLCRKYTIPCT